MVAQKARRADKNTDRGNTPAKNGGNGSPERATEVSVTPFGGALTYLVWQEFRPGL